MPLRSPGPSWREHPCRASPEAGGAGRRPEVPSSLALPGSTSMASPGPSCQCLLPSALPWAELALDPTSPGPLPSSFRGVRPPSQGASSPPSCHQGLSPGSPGKTCSVHGGAGPSSPGWWLWVKHEVRPPQLQTCPRFLSPGRWCPIRAEVLRDPVWVSGLEGGSV